MSLRQPQNSLQSKILANIALSNLSDENESFESAPLSPTSEYSSPSSRSSSTESSPPASTYESILNLFAPRCQSTPSPEPHDTFLGPESLASDCSISSDTTATDTSLPSFSNESFSPPESPLSVDTSMLPSASRFVPVLPSKNPAATGIPATSDAECLVMGGAPGDYPVSSFFSSPSSDSELAGTSSKRSKSITKELDNPPRRFGSMVGNMIRSRFTTTTRQM